MPLFRLRRHSVLRLSEISEKKIAMSYNSTTIKAQKLLGLVKKILLSMIKMRYRKNRPKRSFVAFVLKISM